ncbi:MAG: hypothetical protein HC802_14475 [Caldilineaceae bacterium]|nr:hypothetical protein [Caldilineaceae bacterium]
MTALYPDVEDGGMWVASDGVSYVVGDDWTTYTEVDGLVANDVTAITLDSQNRAWFGSNTGLSIWNGSTFFNLTAENGLPSEEITSLLAADDSVWIGTREGGFYRFEKNQLQVFNITNADLPSDDVLALAIDDEGVLLVGTDLGLARFADGEVTLVAELGAVSVVALATAPNGEIWAATENDGVWRYDGEIWRRFDADNYLPETVTRILVDSSGGVWFGGESGGVVRYAE